MSFTQSTAHLITLDNILIFSRDKLEIGITVDLQYFLNKDDLPELHDEYDLFYKEIFKQTAKDTIKVGLLLLLFSRELDYAELCIVIILMVVYIIIFLKTRAQ